MVGRGIESTYYKVKNLEERLSKYIIKAPFDGILVNGNISDGAFIIPNQTLGEFIDPNNFELSVNIPVIHVEKIKLDQSISIISDGFQNEIDGFPAVDYTNLEFGDDPLLAIVSEHIIHVMELLNSKGLTSVHFDLF